MKKLILLAAAALSFAASAATPRLDVPYQPGQDIHALVQTAYGWVELYKVEPAGEADAIKTLVEKSAHPPAIAVDVEGRLHFTQEGAPGELGEAALKITRKGEAIEYDDGCKVIPKKGDVIETVYRSSDDEVEIVVKATVRDHYAFGIVGETAREATRLTLTKKEHCDAVIESRIISAGTLTFKLKGKVVFREPILQQHVTSQ